MFQNIYPVFETKKLLKKEMLDSLRDFPRELFDLQYRGYSDGILMGCELEGYEGGLKIMPGILYYQGIPYFLKRPFDISVQADGNLAYLKVRFLGKTVGARQEEYLSQIYIDGRIPDTNCELELGRFKLQVGARLRTEYVDFGDYDSAAQGFHFIIISLITQRYRHHRSRHIYILFRQLFRNNCCQMHMPMVIYVLMHFQGQNMFDLIPI